jgi:chlorobactene glucosyltransferase
MMLYQILILLSLLVFLGILLLNLVDLPDLPSARSGTQPFVSILVPARNEDEHIEACVSSLLAQEYDGFEVIVLDDHSTDSTWDTLQRLTAAGTGRRLRTGRSEPLPEGWHGKAWACHQLAAMARGELLLFTDADTVHRSEALARAVAGLQESGAEMLSLTPAQEMHSFWEKLIVPLVYHILMCYLPVRMVRGSRLPAFCYAIGQFILFRSEAYRKIGGHESVRTNLVEDVWLCKKIKRAGGRVAAYNGTDAVSCRMYRDFRGIRDGFSKNLFAGFGYRTPVLFTLMGLLVMFYILPYGFLFSSLVSGKTLLLSGFWLPAAQIAVALFSRMIIAVKFRHPVSFVLLHVVSQTFLLAIALNSFRQAKFGKGAVWKGRSYRFS